MANRYFPAIFVIAAWLAGASFAEARVGETLEQCTARYGKPLLVKESELPGSKLYAFSKGDFLIMVVFLQEKASFLTFSREDNAAPSEAEIQALLTANQGGLSWAAPKKLKTNDGPDSTAWLRSDGVMALLGTNGKTPALVFITKAYIDAQGAAAAAPTKKTGALNGF